MGSLSTSDLICGSHLSGASITYQEELLTQIKKAFQKVPSLARILHGDRLIRQGGRGRRTALFPSSKCGGNVPLESQLELAYAVVLERSSTVQEYRTQAIRIALPSGRFAYPDFVIRTTSGTFEVHEVKPSIAHLAPEDTQRFNTLRSLLIQCGIGFRLIDINSLPRLGELEDLLVRYSRGHIQSFSPMQIQLAKSLLRCTAERSLPDAYEVLSRHDLPAQIADFLSFHQQWPNNLQNTVHPSGEP
jgi:hypothetical protein